MRNLRTMTISIDSVFVWVTDLNRSVEWYARFGIEAGPAYGDWQTMKVEGATKFALHRGDRPAGGATAGIAFLIADLEVEMARLTGLGIQPTDANVTDTGMARFTTYRDPDGNDVQLLERRA